jgi:alkanesulfonate monooxygenase SsuD/methylene tetrahydromethanopterin reductase-like flavin-dependent oxidoreductase (luciferase family)
VFDRLQAQLREGEAALGRAFRVGIMPLISLDVDRATALARVNVEGLLDEARGKKAWRVDGPFETADDLRGMLVAGSAEDVVAELQALAERGVDEVVLDLRQRMDAYEATLDLLAAEVTPALRSG